MRIPTETKDAGFWDEWWRDRLAGEFSRPDEDMFPRFHQVPLRRERNNLSYLGYDNDDLLAAVMAEYNLRTVLCAGNGVSQEPRALAAAGFDVTALDISPVAVSRAAACHDDRGLAFCSPHIRRQGGRLEFVVGDLLDTTVCPGPFDAIIERRTVQWFFEYERTVALSALSGRLRGSGIFLSHCLDDPFPPELGWSQHEVGWFHASESWFRANGWTIWDGVQSSTLAGRVAWLVRSGSMKPPAPSKDVGQIGTV
jgi:hypothetical protein